MSGVLILNESRWPVRFGERMVLGREVYWRGCARATKARQEAPMPDRKQ